MDRILIYHSPCRDGFCCAWLAQKIWPDIELFPARYSEREVPESVKGKHVMIVDFSYDDRNVLIKMHEEAESLVLLDHHEGADLQLRDLSYCHFDVNRSGAHMFWDWLVENGHIESAAPHWLVQYTEDRDLWKHQLPNTHEVNAAIRSQGFKMENWLEMEKLTLKQITSEGIGITRYRQMIIDHVMYRKAVWVKLQEFETKGAQVQVPDVISEVGHELSKDLPFAVMWDDTLDGRRIHSLRSIEGGANSINVRELAERFPGGGGHAHATGFSTTIEESPVVVLRPVS